jgi:hypothetical protein
LTATRLSQGATTATSESGQPTRGALIKKF